MQRERFRRRPSLAQLVVMALAIQIGTASAQSQITTATGSNVFNSGSKFYSHCTNGYYWVALRNGSSIVFYSSPDGASWASQGAIFSFNPGVNEWAVRYQGNVVVAFAFNSGDNFRYYRKAILNADGTASWNSGEVTVGAADAAAPELNALIANGKPILWRAGPTDAGRFTIGDQLDSPVIWTDTPNAPSLGPAAIPGNGTDGGLSAGAIFAVGGADPDDLVVLRATSAAVDTLGSHRLVSIKYDASLNAFDAAWFNVSTIGGTLTEDNSNEVGVYSTDERAHRRFAVVADSSGNLHAVFRNQLTFFVHYKKDVGFNDSWTRLGGDIIGGGGSKAALTAAASDNLFLYFESSAAPNILQQQRFDGSTWGVASTLFTGTDLQKSLGAMERFGSCAPAVAFTHGAVAPFDVNFTLDTGTCPPLQASEAAGTITVTAPGSFELTFDTSAGGSIEALYDLVEDPGKTTDLAGGLNPKGLHNFGIRSGTNFNTSTDAVSARIHLLEATPTRVRVRQDTGYENNNTGNLLAGVRGVGDYSIYSSGRLALNHARTAYVSVPYQNEYSELVVHYTNGVPPLDTWDSFYQLSGMAAGTGGDDFTLSESAVAGAQTDLLQIFSTDWVAGPDHLLSATLTDRTFSASADRLNAFWFAGGGVTIPAGNVDVWRSLTYFKPTGFVDHNDPNVTIRSTDYRSPDDIAGVDFANGSRWDEDGNNDGYNEAEAAYTFELDPGNGLTFDMDGSGTTRYAPFMKIRQWRSPHDPVVTLDGSALTNDVDYRADVKPVSKAHFAAPLMQHVTLESAGAVMTPDIGGAGSLAGTPTFVAARYGNGLLVDAVSESVSFSSTGNIDFNQGAIEFWFQPNYDHTDGVRHRFWNYSFDFDNSLFFEKHSSDELRFGFRHGPLAGDQGTARVLPADYSWKTGDWVHLRAVWDTTASTGQRLRIFVNGVEPPTPGPGNDYIAGNLATGGTIILGVDSGGANPMDGIMDEYRLYGADDAPTSLAAGGLQSNASEYLASATNNFQLAFAAVDAARRGEYAYFGSDAEFRGLNVALAIAGAGVSVTAIEWQYWNGTSWAAAAFTADETESFTKTGTIYWASEPASWAPYSVNGGPDLYYVRAHLKSGEAYTTLPTEAFIKTDILLFQYCGDISVAGRTFDFALPAPTAVELTRFDARGVDGAAELSWETASELDNMGFHLYRATRASGPFARVTARLIPGLGSSPAGASYRYRDVGLENGVTYFYELQDVETSGRTERHGPVEVTPMAHVSPEPEAGAETGDTGARMTYGSPESSTFRVLPRRNGVVVELVTNGFVATAQSDGTVRLEVPGLEEVDGSSLPVKRAWIEAVAGRGVELVSVRTRGVSRFTGLHPSSTLVPELVASSAGTVRAERVRRGRRRARGDGARIVEVGYQGESKRALVELSPFSWDRRGLALAQMLEVRFRFRGVEASARRGRRTKNGVAARLVTVERGLYAASLADLLGRRRARSAREMRLSRQGETVAHHLDRGVLYFWSEGAAANPYGSEAVYELELGRPGETLELVDPRDIDSAFYWDSVHREENHLYQASLVDAPDVWLWDVVFAPDKKSFEFEIADLVASGVNPELRVWLQGASDVAGTVDHHVEVSVNGSFVGEARWDGKSAHQVAVALDPAVLLEGINTLEIDNVGDTGAPYSMVMLDRFRARYPRDRSVLDNARFVVAIGDHEGASHSYVAIEDPLRPEIRRVRPTNLEKRRRAEYLVIGPESFIEAAEPLVRHRREQGLTVATASTEAIASAFGHGELTPESIRELIAHVYHRWRAPKLRYVVLLGDATYDFKDYLGTGVINRVPPYLVRTSYLWTASDPAYAAVHGDDLLPDVAIGRLPASSANELRAMVAKILAYETDGPSTPAPFVLVADDADRAGEFERDADEIATTLLAGHDTERIYLRELGAVSTRDAIEASFDAGASTMSYLGHGAIHLWADENVFNASRVDALSPQAGQPLLLTMNCLNGYFHFPYFDSLAEALLKPRDRGAIAAFSPSGLSLNEPAHRYHKALLEELLAGEHRRLGDVVLAAQKRYADSGAFPELLAIYHLFGDPASVLR